jgi:aryl-alcohol dehydrogenase-like predicted oxidoreductase
MKTASRTSICGGTLPISRIVQGTWQLSGEHGPVDPKRASRTFAEHRAVGIDTIDTSDSWGEAEALAGAFSRTTLHSPLGEGRPPRVLTRYTPEPRYRISKADVAAALRLSCARLGVRRLDLVQFDWGDFAVRHYVQTAQHLHALVAEGELVGALGVVNFDVVRLKELLDAGVNVSCVQVQLSLLDRRAERGVERAAAAAAARAAAQEEARARARVRAAGGGGGARRRPPPAAAAETDAPDSQWVPESLLSFCEARRIDVLAHGVLAGGFLSESYLGALPPRATLPTASLNYYLKSIHAAGGTLGHRGAAAKAAAAREGWTRYQQLLLGLEAISVKHGCTIPNLAIAWALERRAVAAVVVGARDDSHVLENLRALEVRLDREDHALVERLLGEAEGPAGDCYCRERLYATGGGEE